MPLSRSATTVSSYIIYKTHPLHVLFSGPPARPVGGVHTTADLTWSPPCHSTPRTFGGVVVHGGQHEGDVGGEKVIHLVAQAGLTEQSATPYQVADGHVEVVGPTAPVGDLGKGVDS